MLGRHLKKHIKNDALTDYKIAFIPGPWQVGKTTLALHLTGIRPRSSQRKSPGPAPSQSVSILDRYSTRWIWLTIYPPKRERKGWFLCAAWQQSLDTCGVQILPNLTLWTSCQIHRTTLPGLVFSACRWCSLWPQLCAGRNTSDFDWKILCGAGLRHMLSI